MRDLIKNNYDKLFLLVLVFSFLIRLKFFNMNAALWFDEADYLSIAKHWVYGVEYYVHFVRPIMLPLIAAFFYKIGLSSEIWMRLLMLVFSTSGVLLIYLVGRELVGRKAALIGAAIFSCFYLNLFFTSRILVGMPTTTIWLLASYLFLKGYVYGRNKWYLILLGPVIVFGVLMRFPLGLVAVVILAYLLITEGLKFLKNKYLWYSGIISVLMLIPYFVWYYRQYGEIAILHTGTYYQKLFLMPGYLKLFPTYFYSPIPFLKDVLPGIMQLFLIVFVIGLLVVLFDLIAGYNLVRKDKTVRNSLFVFLSFILPFLYFSFQDHVEPRYMFYIFPWAFLMAGYGLVKVYNYVKKYNKHLAVILVGFVVIVGCYYQLDFGKSMAEGKKDSYVELKYAGEWIKENSEAGDIVISAGGPQLTYYSEREIVSWENTLDEQFEKNEVVRPRYAVVTVLEGSPDWTYTFVQNSSHIRLVMPFFMDVEGGKALHTGVYEWVY